MYQIKSTVPHNRLRLLRNCAELPSNNLCLRLSIELQRLPERATTPSTARVAHRVCTSFEPGSARIFRNARSSFILAGNYLLLGSASDRQSGCVGGGETHAQDRDDTVKYLGRHDSASVPSPAPFQKHFPLVAREIFCQSSVPPLSIIASERRTCQTWTSNSSYKTGDF